MISELAAVDHVRKARRAGLRVGQRVAAGDLGPHEVDLVDLLFGQPGPEARLARHGLLDDGGLCDEMVAAIRENLKADFARLAPMAAMTELVHGRFLEALSAERRAVPFAKRQVAPGREAIARRNEQRSALASARILAFHLCQRAMVEALAEVLREHLVGQATGDMDEGLLHGPLQLRPEHMAEADEVIGRLRRPHLAGLRARPPNLGALAHEPEEALPTADVL